RARVPGLRHDVRRQRHALHALGRRRRRRIRLRRPGHAGGTGGRSLPAVARRAPRNGARAAGAAQQGLARQARSTQAVRAVAWLWKAFCYTLGVAVMVFAVVQGWFFMHILYWKHWNPESTSFMETRLLQLRERDPKAQLQYRWVD